MACERDDSLFVECILNRIVDNSYTHIHTYSCEPYNPIKFSIIYRFRLRILVHHMYTCTFTKHLNYITIFQYMNCKRENHFSILTRTRSTSHLLKWVKNLKLCVFFFEKCFGEKPQKTYVARARSCINRTDVGYCQLFTHFFIFNLVVKSFRGVSSLEKHVPSTMLSSSRIFTTVPQKQKKQCTRIQTETRSISCHFYEV